jgi:hypothetical protein
MDYYTYIAQGHTLNLLSAATLMEKFLSMANKVSSGVAAKS